MKKLLLMAAFAIGCISASAQKTLTLSTYKGTDLAKYDGQTMNVSVSRYLFRSACYLILSPLFFFFHFIS